MKRSDCSSSDRALVQSVRWTLTDPPRVRIAEAGLGYPDRVKAMLPDQYEPWAFGGFHDPSLPTALQQRYLDEVANLAIAVK